MAYSPEFIAWCAARDILAQELETIAARWNAIDGTGSGPCGLTPDHIKARPDWRAAHADYWRAHRALAAHNGAGMRRFRREIAQEARERRAARERERAA